MADRLLPMSAGPQRRRGERRPYKPDTEASSAEEAGVRRALAAGTVALAPPRDGWVEVWAEHGALVEALARDAEGRSIGVWDRDGLSRWMRGDGLRQKGSNRFGRLRAWLGAGVRAD